MACLILLYHHPVAYREIEREQYRNKDVSLNLSVLFSPISVHVELRKWQTDRQATASRWWCTNSQCITSCSTIIRAALTPVITRCWPPSERRCVVCFAVVFLCEIVCFWTNERISQRKVHCSEKLCPCLSLELRVTRSRSCRRRLSADVRYSLCPTWLCLGVSQYVHFFSSHLRDLATAFLRVVCCA